MHVRRFELLLFSNIICFCDTDARVCILHKHNELSKKLVLDAFQEHIDVIFSMGTQDGFIPRSLSPAAPNPGWN